MLMRCSPGCCLESGVSVNVRVTCPGCATNFIVMRTEMYKAVGDLWGIEGEVGFREKVKTDETQRPGTGSPSPTSTASTPAPSVGSVGSCRRRRTAPPGRGARRLGHKTPSVRASLARTTFAPVTSVRAVRVSTCTAVVPPSTGTPLERRPRVPLVGAERCCVAAEHLDVRHHRADLHAMLSLTSVNSIISDYFEAGYQRVNPYR
jgi:hypothetical protein